MSMDILKFSIEWMNFVSWSMCALIRRYNFTPFSSKYTALYNWKLPDVFVDGWRHLLFVFLSFSFCEWLVILATGKRADYRRRSFCLTTHGMRRRQNYFSRAKQKKLNNKNEQNCSLSGGYNQPIIRGGKSAIISRWIRNKKIKQK